MTEQFTPVAWDGDSPVWETCTSQVFIPDWALRRTPGLSIELKVRGYRPAERHPEIGGGSDLYVRPMLRWGWYRVLRALTTVHWRALGFAYEWALYHYPQDFDATIVFRWKDMRPGPGRVSRR